MRPFLRLIADSTLRTIRKRWPDLLSADVVATYQLYLDHYDTEQSAGHWSSACW